MYIGIVLKFCLPIVLAIDVFDYNWPKQERGKDCDNNYHFLSPDINRLNYISHVATRSALWISSTLTYLSSCFPCLRTALYRMAMVHALLNSLAA